MRKVTKDFSQIPTSLANQQNDLKNITKAQAEKLKHDEADVKDELRNITTKNVLIVNAWQRLKWNIIAQKVMSIKKTCLKIAKQAIMVIIGFVWNGAICCTLATIAIK